MAIKRSAPSPSRALLDRGSRHSEARRPATRSLSRITESESHDDDEGEADATPRQATRDRRTSFASTSRHTKRSKSRTAVSVTERGSDQQTPRVKRTKLRPSLAGPQVHEMNIETRAQVLIPIAEDCIIQLLKAGLNGSIYRKNAEQTWQQAWDNLQSQRRNKLFSPDSLPFNDFEDVREAFHSSVRGHINTASLERAIHLSNLATFLWVILQPDEAHTLLGTEERTRISERSRKRPGRQPEDEDNNRVIRDRVGRRNRVFGMAWKRYWKDVIPHSMRANKHSINLWAHLSVQIMMTFRREVIDGKQHANYAADLPPPEAEFAAELFSAAAITRYGQWSNLGSSAQDQASKENAQRRWTEVAKHRRTDLREVKEEVLIERYPYDEFRRAILGFVDEAVLHTLLSRSVSPRKPVMDEITSSTSASEQDEDQGSQIDGDVEAEVDAEDEADVATELGIQGVARGTGLTGPHPATGSAQLQMDEDHTADDLDLDLDILDQVLMGMTPDAFDQELEKEPHDDDDDFPSDINSEEPEHETLPRRARSNAEDIISAAEQDDLQPQGDATSSELEPQSDDNDFPSSLASGGDGEIPDDEQKDDDDHAEGASWAVKDAPVPMDRARRTERNFQFAARQVSAEQVAWENQSLASKRKAKTPLFLPQDSEIGSNRAVSATPRANEGVTRAISDTSPHPGSPVIRDRDHERDQEDLVPGSSVLNSPEPADRTSHHVVPLAPSPIGREQSGAAGKSRYSVGGVNDLGVAQSGGERPSGSPSPRRLVSRDPDLVDDLPAALPMPIPSSSRDPPAAIYSRPLAQSHRTSAEKRKRRHNDVEGDFASVVSSEDGDDADAMAAVPQETAIPVPSMPRQLARRTLGPPRETPQRIATASPRSLADRRDIGRDFIIIPQIRHQSRLLDQEDGQRPANRATGSRQSRRSASHASVRQIDYFMCDEDGSPLETDPEYILPFDYKPTPSQLHGRTPGQSSLYSRKGGRRKWSLQEQLLLWRTVQKVPLDEAYPLTVVDHLHGEFGVLSTELQDYNKQHMKDKMKLIVQTRINNQRVVEGRARFWLPPLTTPDEYGNFVHPEKVALEEEVYQAAEERRTREREAMEEDAAELQRHKDLQKAKRKGKKRAARHASTEDELKSDDEEGAANTLKNEAHTPGDDDSYVPGRVTRSQRGRGKPTRGRASRGRAASQRAAKQSTTVAPEPSAAAEDPNEAITPDDADAEQKPRRLRIACVEVPSSRPISRSRLGKQADSANMELANATQKQIDQPDFAVQGARSHDVSESEAETEYEVRNNGKMMRRSIGQRAPSPDIETLSLSPSDDEEDDEDSLAAAEEYIKDEDISDEVDSAYGGHVYPDGERGPIEIPFNDATHDYHESESDEDETERNERLARQYQLQQKVLGGEEP